MKLKFFSFLAVFFAAAFTANAQEIAGTYNGTMTIEVVIPEPNVETLPNQNILITEEGGGLVKLSILNFSFLGLDLGNLEVAGISTTNNDGTITLSKGGFSDGPAVDLGGGPGSEILTLIKLNSAGITSGILTLDLSVYLDFPEIPIEEANVANVSFVGDQILGILSPKVEQITVYPTVASNEITVTGFENAAFSVFNQSGVLVKQGKLSAKTINISALNAGVYILNINGASVLFIKK